MITQCTTGKVNQEFYPSWKYSDFSNYDYESDARYEFCQLPHIRVLSLEFNKNFLKNYKLNNCKFYMG